MQRYTYFILQSKYLRIYEDSFGTKILRDDCALKIRLTDNIVVKCRANISLIQHFMYWSHLIDRRDGNMDNDFSRGYSLYAPTDRLCPLLDKLQLTGEWKVELDADSESMLKSHVKSAATAKFVHFQIFVCVFKNPLD